MKITAHEEYGLRILLRIANCKDSEGLSIAQLSETEGLSFAYVAKMTRLLRLGDFIKSTPGNRGGYLLARSAESIAMKEVIKNLGGDLFDNEFCNSHNGGDVPRLCTNSADCSARTLWTMLQLVMDEFLERITLKDLIRPEHESAVILKKILESYKVEVNG